MSNWTPEELAVVDRTDELHVAVERSDGTLRDSRIVWVVRVSDDLYIRSAHGLDGAWYRAAVKTRLGRVTVAGIERDVHLEDAAGHLNQEIDDAFWAKYGRYPAQYVEPVTNEASHSTTIRLVPR